MKNTHLDSPAGIAWIAIAFSVLIGTAPAEPIKATGSFTLYYVAEVDPAKASSGGVAGKVKTTEGKYETYRLSYTDTKSANMQGTVAVKEPDGGTTIVSIAKVGEWIDLPKGWHGKGNKMNPLTPYRVVAADQKYHPYGSRIFISDVKDFKTPEGEVLDGYFWVADVGGGIKGANRFDVFVGTSSAYLTIMKQPGGGGKWTAPIEVENLPKPPSGMDPQTSPGLVKILEGLGYEVEDTGAGREKALIDFQKQHEKIPATEHGKKDAAITLWYLTQAALAVKEGKAYPATK